MRSIYYFPILISNFIINLIKKILWNNNFQASKIKKICIYRIGSLGDICCSIPALQNIKNNFQDSEIIFLTSSGVGNSFSAESILKHLNLVDHFISYKKITNKIIKQLSQLNIDLFIELPTEKSNLYRQLRNMFFAYFIGAKNGFGWKLISFKPFRKKLNQYFVYDNEVIRLNNIINDNLNKLSNVEYPNNFNKSKELNILNKFQLKKNQYLCISFGARKESKIWPPENFAQLVNKILDEFNFEIIFLGSEAEKDLYFKIIDQVHNSKIKNIKNLISKTDIIESMYILKNSHLLISNDTGTQHLASITETKILSIFSSRDFKNKWYPYGDKNIILRSEINCQVCLLDLCPFDNKCLKLISPNQVYNSFKLLIN